MRKSKTKEQFLLDAVHAHGDRYDYSNVEYVNSYTHIKVNCRRCQSDFQTMPANHTHRKRSGCPKCARDDTKITLKEFVERSRAFHGDRYDYSLTILNGINSKVKITCRICESEFEQEATVHFRSGCPTCFGKSLKTIDQFVREAVAVHGQKYDYTRSVYLGNATPLEIICRTCHESFCMKPNNHLSSKSGCECHVNRKHRLSTLKRFIERAHVIHGDKYDYTLATYCGSRIAITIVCDKGHLFKQTPSVHINAKCGCPYCSHVVSDSETQWLDSLNILPENRQKRIPKTRYRVDALEGQTVYEFYGAFWHGDPRRFPQSKLNPKTRFTYGEMYKHTLERHTKLIELGYIIKYVWELDWLDDLQFSKQHPML